MNTLLKITIGLILLYILIAVTSCGQKSWTKRGYNHGWIKSEIKYDTFYTDSVTKDTVFRFGVVRDTVVIKEDKLTVKYFYNSNDSTVYLYGKCDPDSIIVPVEVIRIETKKPEWRDNMILILLGALAVLAVITVVKSKKA